MSDYTYEDPGIGKVAISEVARDGEACIRHDDADHIHLPAAERVKAAQALAGDKHAVVPSWEWELLSPDHVQPPIDPSAVRVGDVVEVEANDGSWMVRGRVDAHGINSAIGQIFLHPGPGWTDVETDVATVRLVSRPDPEPDPEQVKELAHLIGRAELAVGPKRNSDHAQWWDAMAGLLVRNGVTVGERDE